MLSRSTGQCSYCCTAVSAFSRPLPDVFRRRSGRHGAKRVGLVVRNKGMHGCRTKAVMTRLSSPWIRSYETATNYFRERGSAAPAATAGRCGRGIGRALRGAGGGRGYNVCAPRGMERGFVGVLNPSCPSRGNCLVTDRPEEHSYNRRRGVTAEIPGSS